MFLKVLKKMVGFMTISLLVVSAHATSEYTNLEKGSTGPTRSQQLKTQLDGGLNKLYEVLGDAIKNDKDTLVLEKTLKENITSLSKTAGFSVSFAEGDYLHNSFRVVASLDFGPYTFSISRRLGVRGTEWFIATEIGENYIVSPYYREGGNKEDLDELIKGLTSRQ